MQQRMLSQCSRRFQPIQYTCLVRQLPKQVLGFGSQAGSASSHKKQHKLPPHIRSDQLGTHRAVSHAVRQTACSKAFGQVLGLVILSYSRPSLLGALPSKSSVFASETFFAQLCAVGNSSHGARIADACQQQQHNHMASPGRHGDSCPICKYPLICQHHVCNNNITTSTPWGQQQGSGAPHGGG